MLENNGTSNTANLFGSSSLVSPIVLLPHGADNMPYKNPNYRKEYRDNNKEKIKGLCKEYREKNSEKIKRCKRDYYRKNIKCIGKHKKEHYIKNKYKIIKKNRDYSLKNKDKIKKYMKEYRIKNKDKLNEKMREYYKKKKKKIRERENNYYLKNKKRYKERYRKIGWYHKKQYLIKNQEEIKKYRKKYWELNKNNILLLRIGRRKNDLNYKILENLRTRVCYALKMGKKSKKTMELVGCSIQELKQHLESKFTFGMNWKNYGFGWHIDHIKPCASFDLSKAEEQQKCFHYYNLQPLWATENLKKSDKIVIE